MNFLEQLDSLPAVFVQQRLELGEIFGFETRNKYAIENERGEPIAYAAEQQKGVAGFLLRQLVGHWRSFDIVVFDSKRQPVMRANHPFRFYFQRLDVHDPAGRRLGALQRRFAFLSKRFDVEDSTGRVILEVSSPIWRLWTFVFTRRGAEAARIEKKWSGLLTEAFTDKDRFRVAFGRDVSRVERQLLLAAAVFVDLQYFENKAGN